MLSNAHRLNMLSAAHRRYLARIAMSERVAARIEAQHAEPIDDELDMIVAEPEVQPRNVLRVVEGWR